MFKLPLLQPSLTGANGVERKDSQSVMAPFATGARSGKESDLAAAVAAAQTATFDVRSWSRQARDITSDLAASDKYKSLALHAEVKLAEALERCERLLGEFAELCGPFAGVLTRLRDELLKGLYSTQYASERGGLAFDQLPWFSVAERLERDKQAMVEERDAVKGQMEAQAEALGRIEEAMSALRRATEASQLEAAALRSHLERLLVRTFWLVLTGQAAEAAAADQRSMLSGLAAVLHSLPPADGGDVAAALERFFPQRPAFRLNKLRDALRTQFPLDTLPLDALGRYPREVPACNRRPRQ
eukprot:XP_001692800.1 predicted protein [Chlamydomonas reinhardtii]